VYAWQQWAAATADPLFTIGSDFNIQASNSPDDFNINVPFTPGVSLIDGGALQLTITVTPTGD
jgi:hypothetical protein